MLSTMWSLSFVAVLLLQCLLHCLGAAAAAGVSTQFLQGPPIGNTCVTSLIHLHSQLFFPPQHCQQFAVSWVCGESCMLIYLWIVLVALI
jgi:hypothetical protein